jgi:hypothetical protein
MYFGNAAIRFASANSLALGLAPVFSLRDMV